MTGLGSEGAMAFLQLMKWPLVSADLIPSRAVSETVFSEACKHVSAL